MRYHNITHNDMKNGDGLRVVLWVAGCIHGCKGCHNPETWDRNGGIHFDESAINELFQELDKDYISGITLSGGDPFTPFNLTDTTDLLQLIKRKYRNKTIWVYTGYVYEDIEEFDVLRYIDVLVDGPYVDQLNGGESLKWRGSSNQRVIDVKKTRDSYNNIILYCD